MKLLRKILFPFNILYFGVVWCRNKCFDWGFFNSKTYDIPTICVGNLTVGGTGKTPLVEFLIQMLQSEYRLAILSRGYGRKTRGFVLVDSKSTAQIIGDEPYQMAQKFPNITIAVDANRQRGIETLETQKPPPELVILDDAFQHRKVVSKCSILLTSFGDLYCDDFVLPSGNLREPRSGAQRADVVVVTKCPEHLDEVQQSNIKKQLKLSAKQEIFFSSINYSDYIFSDSKSMALSDLKSQKFTLVTGIANANPLVNYLKSMEFDFEHLEFSDHHEFSKKELEIIQSKPLVLTTEKDFSRLQSLTHNALFYLPISIIMQGSERFKDVIIDNLNKGV